MSKIITFTFILGLISCSNKNNIEVDYLNLELIELDPNFPVLDKSKIKDGITEIKVNIKKDTSIGFNRDTALTLYKVVYNSSTNSIYTKKPLEWGASYTTSFDSLNRADSLLVSSCFNWKIGIQYEVHKNKLFMKSTINNEHIDTSIFTLDELGRVVSFNGIQYGDLLTYQKSKKVFYSDNTSIPDSIFTCLTINSSDTTYLYQRFFKTGKLIDSIQVTKKERTQHDTYTQIFTNVFSNNILSHQKWYHPTLVDEPYISKK